ncbi:MAG: hypothetical protein AB1Z63_03865 [Candidatus Limnocylindrales bacterium]
MRANRVIRSWLLLVALMAMTGAAPVSGNDTDEGWCAELFEYLTQNTRLSFSDEAAELASDGCVAFIAASGLPFASDGPVAEPSDAAYLEFADRALAAMTEVQRAAGSGLSGGGSFADEARSFESLAAWAESERVWLQANPPAACWADIHRRWTEGIDHIAGGARTMVEGIRERDLDLVSAASDRLLGAVDLLNELRGLMGGLDC